MRGAACAIIAALLLSVSIVLAIEMTKGIIVVRNVESVQTLMTIVAHLTAPEQADRVHHDEKGKCGPRPERISERGKAFIRQHEGLRLDQYYDSIGYAIGYGMHTWQGRPVTRTFPDSPTEADVENEFDAQ